jgi:hypothetical protein
MRKLILSAMLIAGSMNISKSQSSVDDIYSCVNPLFNNLTDCLFTNDVSGRYSGGGSVLFFQPDAGIQYSQMSGCIENYNKDRVVCPTAPLLVIGNGQKKKKTIL